MVYSKTIVCLANSIKRFPNRCVAGKEIDAGNIWIRPVTGDRATEGAIPPALTICTDRRMVDVLDIIGVPFQCHVPQHCQTENHLVSAGRWVKHGRATWNDLPQLVDGQPDLWGARFSSRYGQNDEITARDAENFQDSLRLLNPRDFVLQIREEDVYGTDRVKKAMRGTFTHCGRRYLFKVTDPVWTDRLRNYNVGDDIAFDDVFITVSVSDEFRGMHYKLIAAIITPDRC